MWIVVLLLLSFCGNRPDFSATVIDQATPPVRRATKGWVSFFVKDNAIAYEMELTGFRPLDSAFLHLGAIEHLGPPVALLYPRDKDQARGSKPSQNLAVRGTIRTADLKGPLQGDPLDSLVSSMQRRRTYVSMVLGGALGGVIRGEVR